VSTIADAKKERAQMDAQLKQAIMEFEERTGLLVNHINIVRYNPSSVHPTAGKVVCVQTEVTL
jgi:hypothetical protein